MGKITEIKPNNPVSDDIKELLERVTSDINDPTQAINGVAFVVVKKSGDIARGWAYTDRRFEMLGAIESLKKCFCEEEEIAD